MFFLVLQETQIEQLQLKNNILNVPESLGDFNNYYHSFWQKVNEILNMQG